MRRCPTRACGDVIWQSPKSAGILGRVMKLEPSGVGRRWCKTGASTRPVAEGTPLAGVQLFQGHCPVQHVAASHPEFCEAERAAFSEVLGVHVQRLASLAHGDHVCTTFIPTPAVPRVQDAGPPGPHAAPGVSRHLDTPDQTDAHQKKEQR